MLWENNKDSTGAIANLFPELATQNYFNTGGLGPTLQPVTQVVIDAMTDLQLPVNHGHNLIEKARPYVAEFVGCEPTELAFTRNATEGNATIASGMDLKPGDEVIIDSHAHQGGALTWLTRQQTDGIKVNIFDPCPNQPAENVRRIESLITDKTRVIQVSHVTAPTGIKMPVREIGAVARKRNIWFHVDGAQSLGMFPFKVSELNCDSFAASCHKWMCGPLGTGILYVRHDKIKQITPTEVGSYAETSWDLPGTLKLRNDARRFECGTRNAPLIVGIRRCVEVLQSIGMDNIERRTMKLARNLSSRLRKMKHVTVHSPVNPELATPMVTFTVEGMSCDQVFRQLSKNGFRCRPVRERNLDSTRVSTHFFNTHQQIERIVSVIADMKPAV